MKRGEPPKRKTPLKRATTPLKRTPLKRSVVPIRSRGKKAERELDVWLACKKAVKYRSGGWCEADSPACPNLGNHRAVHVHHVWPEDRDRGIHDPSRCLHVCAASHDWIHAHPVLAARLGLLRPDRCPPHPALR